MLFLVAGLRFTELWYGTRHRIPRAEKRKEEEVGRAEKSFWVAMAVLSGITVIGFGWLYSQVDYTALHDLANPTCQRWSGRCDPDLFMSGVAAAIGMMAGMFGAAASIIQLGRRR